MNLSLYARADPRVHAHIRQQEALVAQERAVVHHDVCGGFRGGCVCSALGSVNRRQLS